MRVAPRSKAQHGNQNDENRDHQRPRSGVVHSIDDVPEVERAVEAKRRGCRGMGRWGGAVDRSRRDCCDCRRRGHALIKLQRVRFYTACVLRHAASAVLLIEACHN